MLDPIKTNCCGRCGERTMVICYDIKDGQYIQLCKECIKHFMAKFMENASESDIKKYLPRKI